METKSFLSSSTIWGIAVAALVGFLDRQGIHVGDLVAPLGAAVAQFVNALAVLIPIIVAIRGRFVASQPLHIFPPTPPPANSPIAKAALVALCVSILALGLAGCGSSGGVEHLVRWGEFDCTVARACDGYPSIDDAESYDGRV